MDRLQKLREQAYKTSLDETLRDLGVPEEELEELRYEGIYTVRDAIMYPATVFRDLFGNALVATIRSDNLNSTTYHLPKTAYNK